MSKQITIDEIECYMRKKGRLEISIEGMKELYEINPESAVCSFLKDYPEYIAEKEKKEEIRAHLSLEEMCSYMRMNGKTENAIEAITDMYAKNEARTIDFFLKMYPEYLEPKREEQTKDKKKKDAHADKIKIIRKYADRIKTSFPMHIKGSIPSKKIDKAISKYAYGLDRDTIIALYDTSLGGSGKEGYVFTDTKVYYGAALTKPGKIWYDDIKEIKIISKGKKDCDDIIRFILFDGTVIDWNDSLINKKPLKEFFSEIMKYIGTESSEKPTDIQFDAVSFVGAAAAGYATSTRGQVNRMFDEEKFHAQQGHGFAAERANDLFDSLTGHDTKILGDDNVKNGADRVVDGIMIQSKYCQTGAACVNECFDQEGNFRYLFNGKPMQIEVPSDKFDAAVSAMEDKIRAGKVPGVSDPNEAKSIIRKGHFTYEQAKNIAKAGTIESITYDAVHGVITASSAFGVTALITFGTNIWNGEEIEDALRIATFSGLKVGGVAFASTIIASQLSKAGLNSALVGSTEAIANMMGTKACSVLANAFRNGSKIYGAAATKSAAKLLRGNAITAGVTFLILSSFDVVNIFRGRISGKQLFKNLTSTASGVAGATAGAAAGAAIGSVVPGVGNVVGGIVGGFIGGATATKATDSVLGVFIEDDVEEMVDIIQKQFEEIAVDYLLSQKEAEKTVDKLRERLDGKTFKNMFASDNREVFARNLLIPIVENEIAKRPHIGVIPDEAIVHSLKDILEDIADEYEADGNPSYA